jgi:hypothetical protein
MRTTPNYNPRTLPAKTGLIVKKEPEAIHKVKPEPGRIP